MPDQMLAGFELSPVQELLNFVSNGDAAFQCQSALLIEGPIDAPALEGAISKVVARYEIMRTNFRILPGRRRLVQVVQPDEQVSLNYIDLRGQGKQEELVETTLLKLRSHAHNLENDALARFDLIVLGGARHIFTTTVNSLCADSQTLSTLNKEIVEEYAGIAISNEDPLQYADFAAWQKELLESEEPEAAEGKKYWSELSAEGVISELPYARAELQGGFAPRSFSVSLSASAMSHIQSLASSSPESARNFLAACWISLVFRLTHQSEGLCGFVVDGRNYDELVGALGLMSKTLPIIWHIADDMPFADLTSQVAKAAGTAVTMQDAYPAVNPDGSITAIECPLTFEWIACQAPITVGESRFTYYGGFSCTDKFGLKLVGSETAVEIQYDSTRYNAGDINRMAEQFAILAGAAASDSYTKVGELSLLPQSEKQQIVVDWNATEAEFPADTCIHTLFEAQVDKTPGASALVCGDDKYTYAELNTKANKIAHYLRSQGVGRNSPVALCVERSADMIVGLLAILKAGGFYVPVAADLPAARIHGLLEQTQAKTALIQSPIKDRFEGWSGTSIALDTDSSRWAASPDTNPELLNSAGDLAYVIFTSGSTGVPKGVGNRHSGLVNYTSFIANLVGLSAPDRNDAWNIGTVSTLSADLGNTSVFPSLAYGGCLHVIHYETAMDGSRFEKYVRKHPLDMLKITPSHLRALLSSSETDVLPQRYLFLGGEAFGWDLLEQIKKRSSRCHVYNHYGPTETTIGSLTYDTAKGTVTPSQSGTVPIGRPIANTRIYILDEYRQPVPVGVSGELFIGGAGLAAGYLNQPEKTAERFVANHLASDGSEMYQTGDRARYHADGSVEFLGRMDDQVKIRGFRVEPGEVESVLRSHSSVHNAAVLVDEDNQGAKRLVGFYVSTSGSEGIREYLAERLPAYMIPSVLTSLSEIPLNANGKVDRKALLSFESTAQAPSFDEARNAVEESVADIWAQVLKVERVGIHENFFELGGHSLLMTQILARVRSAFHVQLGLHVLFDNPTVASLSAVIENESTGGEDDEEMLRLLSELEGLSDEEVNLLLSEEAMP